jgi:hypothetical protein
MKFTPRVPFDISQPRICITSILDLPAGHPDHGTPFGLSADHVRRMDSEQSKLSNVF